MEQVEFGALLLTGLNHECCKWIRFYEHERLIDYDMGFIHGALIVFC